jgi:hypothetical protein
VVEVRSAERLVEIFGAWPSFHDSEVLEVRLDRHGRYGSKVLPALRNHQSFFRVHVFPFHLTDKNLKAHERSKWAEFRTNLKEGHDWFERTGQPPNVEVAEPRYVFSDR